MPRITPKEHYRRHIVLHGLWLSHDQLFGVLPPGKQWQLHNYYHPTASLTEAAFLTHRTAAAEAELSLPHEAGKGFLELERHYKLALRLVETTGQDIDACVDLALLRAPKTYPAAVLRTKNRSSLPPQRGTSRRPLKLVGIARPEPDVEMLARILVEMVKKHH